MSVCIPWRRCAPLAAAVVLLAIRCTASAQDPFGPRAPAQAESSPPAAIVEKSLGSETPRRMSSDADVLAALDTPVTLNCHATPLAEVAALLRQQANINVDVDARNLEDIGLGQDTPITFAAGQMRLKSALRHVLGRLDLTYTVHDGALVITTPEALENELIARTYRVADLALDDPLAADGAEFDWLSDNIQWLIRPTEWESVGGRGAISAGAGSLVVNQSFQIHTEIANYLSALRKARKIAVQHADRAPPVQSVWADDGNGEAIRAALNKEVQMKFAETPLTNVVAELRETAGINIVIDVRALEDVGIGADTPITRNLKRVTLAGGLSLMLRELDLTWEIRDDALVITTPEEAEAELRVRVYPVLDLVRLKEAGGTVHDEQANDYDTLIENITSLIHPTTWDDVGGCGSIGTGGCGCLAICQTIDVFDEIDALLASYRRVLAEYREHPKAVFTAAVAVDDALHGKLRKALAQPVGKMEFHDAPVGKFAQVIAQRYEVPIQIDRRGLEDVGLDADSKIVTVRHGDEQRGGETLGDALRRALKPHGLKWMLCDGVVLITTKEWAEDSLVVKCYPVRDLIERADDLDDRAALDRRAALYDAVTSRLDPDGWEDAGGQGVLAMPSEPVLIVSQTEENHESLAALLAALRENQQNQKSESDRANKGAGAGPPVNSQCERLYLKNYELHDVSTEETEELAEMVRRLVDASSWDGRGGCSIRPSMTGATIIVRHTAATHRKVYRLLNELGVIAGDGACGMNAAVSRIAPLSLPARDADNTLDRGVVLRVIRLDPENSHPPEQWAAEIRKQVEPESWTNSTVYLRPFRKQLVIRDTLAAQRKIYTLLDKKDALLKPPRGFGCCVF